MDRLNFLVTHLAVAWDDLAVACDDLARACPAGLEVLDQARDDPFGPAAAVRRCQRCERTR